MNREDIEYYVYATRGPGTHTSLQYCERYLMLKHGCMIDYLELYKILEKNFHNKDKKHYIYTLRYDNKIFYVGQTRYLDTRIEMHKLDSEKINKIVKESTGYRYEIMLEGVYNRHEECNVAENELIIECINTGISLVNELLPIKDRDFILKYLDNLEQLFYKSWSTPFVEDLDIWLKFKYTKILNLLRPYNVTVDREFKLSIKEFLKENK